jgi:hypothetical protein
LAALARLEYGHVIEYNEALAAAREGALDKAIAKASLALQARPDFTPAHVLLAKAYAQQQSWRKAQASVTKARELAPGDAAIEGLAREIEKGGARAVRDRERQERKMAAARRRGAEQTLAVHERATKQAFGLGAGLVAVIALVASWFSRRKRPE